MNPQDALDIQNTIARFFRGLDDHDRSLLQGVMARDVAAEHSMVGVLEGFDAFWETVRRLPEGMSAAQHYISNLDVSGEGDEAEVNAYLWAQHVVAREGKQELLPGGASYHFKLRRAEGSWRIARLKNSVRWGDPRLAEYFKPPA